MKKIYLVLISILAIFQFTNVQAQWTTSGTNIYNSNTGFVGVGTTSPSSLFHVSANMTAGARTELLRLEIRGNGGDELGGEGAAINFFTPVTPNPNVLGAQIYSFRESGVNSYSTTALRFSTNYLGTMKDKLAILGNGNVGIGIDTPLNLLDVNGTIHAKLVKVNLTGWPDYVFSTSFELTPISEVKSYIDLNHRLPDIPSADDVDKNGIDLGEMNKLLLKKVEELTLYVIQKDSKESEQQQEINSQTEQLNAEKSKLKQQQEQIDKLENEMAKLINSKTRDQ